MTEQQAGELPVINLYRPTECTREGCTRPMWARNMCRSCCACVSAAERRAELERQAAELERQAAELECLRGCCAMDRACEWCGEQVPEKAAVGRARRYCRRSCRQRAYEARREAERIAAAVERERASESSRDETLGDGQEGPQAAV